MKNPMPVVAELAAIVLKVDPKHERLPALLADARCAICGSPATCTGSYERPDAWAFACDACCGHGCEDGTCQRFAIS